MRLLNFVLPLFFGIGLLLGIYVYGAAGKLLMLLGISESTSFALGAWIALFLVFGAAFFIVKRKVNLGAPSSRKAAIGHVMLAIGNIAAVATTIGPMAIAFLSGRSDYGLYMWFALPVFIVNRFSGHSAGSLQRRKKIQMPNTTLNPAPFGRWTLRDKAPRSAG